MDSHFKESAVTLASSGSSAQRIAWFRRIRWAAVVSLCFTFVCAHYLIDGDLLARPFVLAIACSILLNLALYLPRYAKALNAKPTIGAILVLDTLILTYLLKNYGGHMNPFAMVYLVHVVLAALLVGQVWTWSITALSILCYSGLFWFASQSPLIGMHNHSSGAFDLHLHGMLFSFVLIALLIAGFVSRMRASIDSRDLALNELRAQDQRLASLTTLAAGAAHELSTPLSTISVIIGEISRELGTAGELAQDLGVVRQELARCKRILQRMSGQLLDADSEQVELLSIRELADKIQNIDRELVIEVAADSKLWIPVDSLYQALEALVKNAQRNSNRTSPVVVELCEVQEGLRASVWNDGDYIPEEVLARVGEPFFTTQAPGQGMGLGVFLVKLFVLRYQGQFFLESKPGTGTLATILLPTNSIAKAA